jgi:hypothetical protein
MLAIGKLCSKCGETKPLEDFHRQKASKDGRGAYCKSCNRKATKAWEVSNPERSAARNRAWREANPKRWAEIVKRCADNNREAREKKRQRHNERHPEKARARHIIKQAVYKGRIVKPDACEDCGEAVEDPRNLHAHHDDYSKPLDVAWLCEVCHLAEHGKTKRL